VAKILILIGGHLCTAPRPQKEAETLVQVGHDITVRGFWFDPELVKRDRTLIADKRWHFEPILDFQPQYRLENQKVRLHSRLARELYRRFKIFSPEFLGYGAKAMLKVARQAKADLTIVHSEVGLWVGNQLLNEGYRVGVDFEDWFSEDLLPEARANRPISQLKVLEGRLMRECKYCLTTSHAMADAMADAYQAPKPTVIYNSFPWAERSQIDGQIKDRKNLDLTSVHWFSQTIGPGRGLELLFQALSYLSQPIEIHLRGNYPDHSRQWLEALVPKEWSNLLFIHPTVPNAQLLSRIAEHNIGLALESDSPPSRNLTVTNKIFQYLQAGLTVIATETDGQRELISQHPSMGIIISQNSPKSLASAISALLNNSSQVIPSNNAPALEIAKELSWEICSTYLVNLVDEVLV
jgi:glycosyltransferase involved in cell wall biosynthesis